MFADHYALLGQLREAISTVVIGRDCDGKRFDLGGGAVEQLSTIDSVLACLLTSQHILISGPPGEAKTLLSKTLQRLLADDLPVDGEHLRLYSRISGVPDLLPMDVLGAEKPFDGRLVFQRGPIFARIVHVDEINRISPRTSSAFFESMAEKTVTIFPATYPLGPMHFLVATINPLDPGTYPMGQAQLDRFALCRSLAPVSDQDLVTIALRAEEAGPLPRVKLSALLDTIEWLQARPVPQHEQWALGQFVIALRSVIAEQAAGEGRKTSVSPRAFQALVRLVKALAFFQSGGREGEMRVTPKLALPVAVDFLRHRILPIAEMDSPNSEASLMSMFLEAYERCRIE
jgi:MoxR-like ATPase